jgi:hypothetical protein
LNAWRRKPGQIIDHQGRPGSENARDWWLEMITTVKRVHNWEFDSSLKHCAVSVEPLGSEIFVIYHNFASKNKLTVEYLNPLKTTTTEFAIYAL